MVRFEDFCRSTGLDRVTVENLMRTELLDVSLWRGEEQAHPFGIFDDVLPSRQRLAEMGLPVSDAYNPESLRSYDEQPDDDVDGAQDGP